jgi:hypothetical protein
MRAGKFSFLAVAAVICLGSAGCAAGGAGTLSAETDGALTIVGVRLTSRDAVSCPEIRTDDGKSIAVSGLSADVAIGDRIEVSGTMGAVTTCTGPVLIVTRMAVVERGANRTEIPVPRVPGN